LLRASTVSADRDVGSERRVPAVQPAESSAPTDVRLLTRRLSPPVLAVHGGAGAGHGPSEVVADGLLSALEAGWAVLTAGGGALEAAVAAVAAMEDSGTFNAGRGAVPTTAGSVETDAALMGALPDGREVSGGVCAVTWPANPVLAARAVALAGDALLLAGDGADRFAASAGLDRRDPATLTAGAGPGSPVSSAGTVGAVALDGAGALAAATSTGGRSGQPPGRVGDSPIIGAGTWAEQGRVAISATGEGEAFVRAGFAHRVDLDLVAGTPLAQATSTALRAVTRWGGSGGAILLGADGELVVAYDTPAMARGWRSVEETVAGLDHR